MLYAFFWVIPRHLNFICRFRTLCLFHLSRQVGTYAPTKMEQCVPKRGHIKFRCQGITQKKACNIQNMAKSSKSRIRYQLESYLLLSTQFYV